ncbi:MAG: hypothetical protein J6X59_03875 [Bacteroidales bacterium]|nr:hypothetical protein [Bacteroidales bacterium]
MKNKFLIILTAALLAAACGNNTTQQAESAKQTPSVDRAALKAVAELALGESFAEGAQSGRILVTDVATGNLLLDYGVVRQGDCLSATVTIDSLIEPASLLSTALVATILDDPAMDLDTSTMLRVWSKLYGDKIDIHDSHRIAGSDSLPLHTAFAEASNVALCELGEHYYSSSPEEMRSQLLKLFPSAKSDSITNPRDFYRLCMGYGIRISPKCLLDFYTAVANGGVNATSGQRVCSTETAATLKALLREVVEKGAVKGLASGDYAIAGKASLTTSLTMPGRSTAMFVGFFPADSPRYACLVILELEDVSSSHIRLASSAFHQISDHLMKVISQ